MGTFHGNLIQVQPQQVGIAQYIWQMSEDEQVRLKHRERNKKIFSWNNPPF